MLFPQSKFTFLNYLEGGGPMKGLFINGLFSNLCCNTCITYKVLKGLKNKKIRAPILLLNGAPNKSNLD